MHLSCLGVRRRNAQTCSHIEWEGRCTIVWIAITIGRKKVVGVSTETPVETQSLVCEEGVSVNRSEATFEVRCAMKNERRKLVFVR